LVRRLHYSPLPISLYIFHTKPQFYLLTNFARVSTFKHICTFWTGILFLKNIPDIPNIKPVFRRRLLALKYKMFCCKKKKYILFFDCQSFSPRNSCGDIYNKFVILFKMSVWNKYLSVCQKSHRMKLSNTDQSQFILDRNLNIINNWNIIKMARFVKYHHRNF
jgi:hypothetical protein